MSLTIYDIAKKADTSVSTVSRYLNNKNVRPEAKARIEQVLKENNFKPNAMARALVSKTLKTVAVITVDIRVPHYANIAYQIEQKFSQKGYNVIICNISSSIDKCQNYIDSLISRQIDGMVFVGSIFDELNKNEKILETLEEVPVVMNNCILNLANSRSVLVDDEYSILMAYEYLYKKGRRNIYYVGNFDNTSANKKFEGFKKACLKYNVNLDNHYIVSLSSVKSGEDVVDKLYNNSCLFDALICGEDVCAVGIINKLKEKGYSVGENIDVIGCNNTIYSTMTIPLMTIIDNKPIMQANASVDMLEQMILKKEVSSLTITPELLIRGSA